MNIYQGKKLVGKILMVGSKEKTGISKFKAYSIKDTLTNEHYYLGQYDDIKFAKKAIFKSVS